MIKTIGLCILLFTIFFGIGTRKRALLESLSRYEWMNALLSFISREMGCYMRPVSDILAAYDRRTGENRVAEDLLDDGRRALMLAEYDEDADRLLNEYFSSVGSMYIREELSLLASVRGEFEDMLERKRAFVRERTRLAGILGGAGAVALFILLV